MTELRVEWGVMFSDGSVRRGFNGRTARRRAEQEVARLLEDQRSWIAYRGMDHEPDNIRLVSRRVCAGEWTEVGA